MRDGAPILVALLLSFLAMAGCRDTTPAETGGEIDGERIVAMSPAVAIILRDLGCEELIVGRHFHDLVLDESVPVIGDQAGIDYERLVAVDPTIVALEWGSSRPVPPQLVELAESRGWRLVNLELLTLAQIREGVTRLANVVGSPEAKERSEILVRQMDATWIPQASLANRAGRVLALFWTDPLGAPGPGSFHFQLLERLGLEMAIVEGGPYLTLDPESVRAMAPDSILLFMPGAAGTEISSLLGPLAGIGLGAVETGRVGVVSSPLCLTPSTSMIGVAQEVGSIIGSWPEGSRNAKSGSESPD